MQLRFIEEVRTRTHGELDINWVGSGQLGGIKENLEAIIVGNLEFCGVANSNLGPLYPPAQLFDLPFLFRDTAHMVKVVRGPIGEAIWRGVEFLVVLLEHVEIGLRRRARGRDDRWRWNLWRWSLR